MGAGTQGGSDEGRNSCGIAEGHAYSIVSAFSMTVSGSSKKFLLMRNPWGTTDYSWDYHKNDAVWTDALVANVPMGVDPRLSATDGFFVMPIEGMYSAKCIQDVIIAHTRDDEGFTAHWYDVDNIATAYTDKTYYTVKPTETTNDLYISLNNYPLNTIP